MLIFLVPAALLALPGRARAIPVEVVSDTSSTSLLDLAKNTITSIKSTLSSALDITNTAANVAKQIKSYVLDPIAFLVSGNMLKSVLSGILGFVNQNHLYVQNLQGYLQNAGDVQAYSFLNQFQSNSNSPYSSAITSSLRANYLQQTSLAGFFAGNKNTLGNYSGNPSSFLAGNWSSGGAGAWFGLTTQCENNPYCLYYQAQDQMTRNIQDTTASKLAQLNWGRGFLSWCGTPTDATSTQTDFGGGGIPQPGDSCTKSDGSQGQIQTPGSIIQDYLSKALGAVGIDKLTGVGDIGADIGKIAGNVSTIMQTVNLATSLFGGSGGLAGVNGVGSYSSPFSDYLNSSTYMGISTQDVAQSAAGSGLSTSDLSSRTDQYLAAWTTIGTAAKNASAALGSLAASCPAEASTATGLLASTVTPEIEAFNNAQSVATNAYTLVATVNAESASGDPSAQAAYASDFSSLSVTPPSTGDVVSAQQDASSPGDAGADPNNPLSVHASTAYDRMNLLAQGARTLQNDPVACPPAPPAFSASPTSGAAPLTVSFSGVGSSIDFGDGSGQAASDNAQIGTATHTYAAAGTYTAKNSDGSTIAIQARSGG